ncbi:MAG: NAD(P)/FAD-dependent oxidoreductase [Alphaproteobacteria bacterium]|nr:NAD(P)/FAD-dependent oxidoreductase [Alphaproteobacteria bacterium]
MPSLTKETKSTAWHAQPLDYEVIAIGAGVCGLYQTYRLQKMGIKFLTLEAGSDVGGTWYWNRYPGARFDSESFTYAYSFSKELLDEWDWSERFAGQPETEAYFQYVAKKFDLRKNIQFNTRVASARYNEENRSWTVLCADGREYTTRFLVTAIGVLSAPTRPRYKGMDKFKGQSFHTFDWPSEPLDFARLRVGIIGTGSTGVQIISEIADKVADLTVFQRRPNWCAPLRNRPITKEEMAEIRASYDKIFARCAQTPGGFIHGPDDRATFDVPEAERLAFWEQLYAAPGFGKWLGNFRDILMDATANAEFTRFMSAKIRERINDPALAEKLIPKDHQFGTRRVPLETNYYECYNRDNVHLVDISETPILEITEKGVLTSDREYEFDLLIYATGFDAITGAYDRIDFVGENGVYLRDKWADGPLTALGVMTTGFPNLLTMAGPQSGSAGQNFPRGIEEVINWWSELLEYIRGNGYTKIEPKQELEDAWLEHVIKMGDGALLGKEKSWFSGYNTNLDREYKPRYLIYMGGAPRYRKRLAEQAQSNYSGFNFS